LDKEDVQQEFRIKLYETILAYDRSIERRKSRGMIRPVPLPYYIKGSLNNFVKDYIKKITDQQSIFVESSKGNEYDYAIFSDDVSEIDTDKNEFVINGFDLLAPLQGLQKTAFTMWLKGTPTTQLQKVFGRHFNVTKLIKSHKDYLKSKRELFELSNVSEIFSTTLLETV
jgi:hypothetical protein